MAEARATFRVLTLNIWNRSGPWPERLQAIRAELRVLQPDVIGLQEVVRALGPGEDGLDQAALLAEGLGYHIAYGRTPSDVEFPFGNAILSRWPITKSIVYPLPRVGTDELRNLMFCEIDAPFGKLPFFTTHLNWKLHEGHVREVQVRELTERVRALAPMSGFPPVVTGDFNAEPDSDEIRFMRGLTSLRGKSVYFADAFALAGDGSPGPTYARRNVYAAAVHEPDRRLDYIFVRGPDDRFRGEPLTAHVCFDQPTPAGVWPTDHFGVTATISI